MRKPLEENEKASAIIGRTGRSDRLKEIDALYQSQIKQIYSESKEALIERQTQKKQSKTVAPEPSIKKIVSAGNLVAKDEEERKTSRIARSPDFESRINKLSLNDVRSEDERVRASTFLQGESVRAIEVLRKENENKEMKIRDLSNKCENLISKLKNFLSPQEFEEELSNLKEFSDRKMQRLQNLFKIKNEQIFFKIKLQIIGLLQQFQVSKEQINGINEVNNESALFSFMVRKLKLKLKDFRSKEQESNFQIQKDKILNQKYEERVHYLMETNQLLKLSESKLKNKIEDLRGQLNQYIEKVRLKEEENEERQNEIFRLKKQYEELQGSNQKLMNQIKNINSDRSDEKRVFQAKEKEMKSLLSSYFMERKKLEADLQEKEGELEEILIREKFLHQENDRVNREYVRWKERYEWLQKEKQTRQREYEEEKASLLAEFEEYKSQNNQGVYMGCKTQTDEALRRVDEYHNAYEKLIAELEEERRISMLRQEEFHRQFEEAEMEWADKAKRIQKMREEEVYELAEDHENRQKELRDEYEKKQELLAEEMQARMKALLAENDKKSTEKMIEVENENDELRREIDSLAKVLEVKESLINAINSNNRKQNQ